MWVTLLHSPYPCDIGLVMICLCLSEPKIWKLCLAVSKSKAKYQIGFIIQKIIVLLNIAAWDETIFMHEELEE